MIIADRLVKTYPAPDGGEKRAVDGLSFHVHAGEIYGLLGPNGAGKTTALRMLCGLLSPTDGRARIHGHDTAENPTAVKQSIGFLTANTGLYQRMTVRGMLRYFARLHGLSPAAASGHADRLIDAFDMAPFAHQRCGSLSTGQRQRANIARAIIADPPALILDEPTLGLDVLSNRVIIDFVRAQRERGKAIVMSTHYLDEAETLCDRIGLLHRGRLIAEGTLEALREQTGAQRLSDIFLKLVEDAPATAQQR